MIKNPIPFVFFCCIWSIMIRAWYWWCWCWTKSFSIWFNTNAINAKFEAQSLIIMTHIQGCAISIAELEGGDLSPQWLRWGSNLDSARAITRHLQNVNSRAQIRKNSENPSCSKMGINREQLWQSQTESKWADCGSKRREWPSCEAENVFFPVATMIARTVFVGLPNLWSG